jgi:hypothetical protein
LGKNIAILNRPNFYCLRPIQMQFFLKNSGFSFLLIWIFLIFFSACQKGKVSELLPESTPVLVKINLPNITAEALKNPSLAKDFQDFFSFDPASSGLDFFQPAYFFQWQEGDWKGEFLLAGISNNAQWKTVLENQTKKSSLALEDGFFSHQGNGFLSVWNEDFTLVYFFDGISGPKVEVPKLVEFLQSKDRLKGKDPFSDEGLLAFKGKWEDKEWLGPLVNLQMEIEGKMEMEGESLVLKAEMVENNISNLLLSYGKPEGNFEDTCGIFMAIKPDIQKLKALLQVLGKEEFPPSTLQILEQMEKINSPVWGSSHGCDEETIRQTLQISAKWSEKKQAEEVENWIKKQIPSNMLSFSYLPENWLTISLPNTPARNLPVFENKKPMLFFLKANQGKAALQVEVEAKKENGKMGIRAEFRNPAAIWNEVFRLDLKGLAI